ncbi:MAG: OmpA family protein, partial [Spirochaetota bacterium]|nr:OmpA family protein [Spirochaetota bacterium]
LVTNMMASIFEAADKINKGNNLLKAGRITPRSARDVRWQAAGYAKEIFGSETQEYWYKYFDVVKVRDNKGLTVEIGGSSVSNLPRNLKYFGLDGGINIGKVVYNRFAKLAMHYYPDFMKGYPTWEQVFNPSYIMAVKRRYPRLAHNNAYLPSFSKATAVGAQIGELTYNIPFQSGKATFTGAANEVLSKALEELVIAANAKVEIHGHTDSQGSPDGNMTLSQQRAQAVHDWLKSSAGSSFPANRVRVVPHGENQLLVPDVVDGQFVPDRGAKNRRVVLKIFSQKD